MPGPVFVIGFPRSGTTLVRAVIGAHPDITMFHEPELIYALRRAGIGPGSKLNGLRFEGLREKLQVVASCRRHLATLDGEVLEAVGTDLGDLSFKDLYERLLPRPNSLVWGEKSLNNTFFVDDLLGLYPDATFVHVIRDPRAAILSAAVKRGRVREGEKSVDKIGSLSTARALRLQATRWVNWLGAARVATRRVPDAQWVEFRFEDFVAAPAPPMGELCEKLRIPFSDVMLQASERSGDALLHANHSKAHHARLGDELDTSRTTVHDKLGSFALATIEGVCAADMREVGYEPRLTGASLSRFTAAAIGALSAPLIALKMRKFRQRRGL